MRVPLIVRIGALVVATTAFYTYVGQMVPQKEVQPPAEIVLKTDLTTADMVKVGREVMEGKGLCFTCHTVGKSGALRFPDLAGRGCPRENARAWAERRRVLRPGDVRTQRVHRAGIQPGDADDQQAPDWADRSGDPLRDRVPPDLGGTPTVTLQTKHHYNGGGGAAAPAAGAAPAAAPATAPATPAAPAPSGTEGKP